MSWLGSKQKRRRQPQQQLWSTKALQRRPKASEADLAYRPKQWNARTKQIFYQTVDTYSGQTIEIPVRKHTDTTKMFEPGHHIFLVGQTGTGKSVFLHGLNYLFYQKGYSIIHRDDGGLDGFLLAPMIDDFYTWVPEGMTLDTLNWELPNEPIFYEPKKPKKLVKTILENKGYHNILFDSYCMMGETTVKFWAPFFREFVFQLQQEPTHLKEKRVLSIDELNDLIQPQQHSWSRAHQQSRGILEGAIRKLRKHEVKLIATSHRPFQVTINVRSQFSYFIFKQTFPKDAYDLLNHFLAAIPNKLFWLILNDIAHKLEPWEFYLFDRRAKFDKYNNKDLPRWKSLLSKAEIKRGVKSGLKTSISGSVDELYGAVEKDTAKKFDAADLIIFLHRAIPKRFKEYHETLDGLVERLATLELPLAKTTIYERTVKMRKDNKWLAEYLTQANV